MSDGWVRAASNAQGEARAGEEARPTTGASVPAEWDPVTLSPEAAERVPPGARTDAERDGSGVGEVEPGTGGAASDETPTDGVRAPHEDGALSQADQKEVKELKARDAEVRRHEAAHAAAGGAHAGSPTFEYETGPDGKRYAVGGEVAIDASPVPNDPAATIAKMQVVRRAALAPAEPSAQDRSVAARAAQREQRARAELATEHGAPAREAGAAEGPREDEGVARDTARTDGAARGMPGERAGLLIAERRALAAYGLR